MTMKLTALTLATAVLVSACGGGSSGGSPFASPASNESGSTESQSSGASNETNVFPQNGSAPGNTGQTTNVGTDNQSVTNNTVTVIEPLGPDADRQDSQSLVRGSITLLNELNSSDVVTITARGLDISGTLQPDGKFELALPVMDDSYMVTLDVTGENVIPKSIDVAVAANTRQVDVKTSVAGRSPAIDFALENGGELADSNSERRVSVAVPAGAFQFEDGTIATGEAQVQITDVDINDLDGTGSWAPDLIGINEASGESFALLTYGMSDFHFSQNGQKLQLRPGQTATIKTDLLSTTIVPQGATQPVEAEIGMIIPLWHYDEEDNVWKEEGVSYVVADAESPSGFALEGEVSHFSTWNHDTGVPRGVIYVALQIVDTAGQPFTGMTIEGFQTTVKVIEAKGNGWSYPVNYTITGYGGSAYAANSWWSFTGNGLSTSTAQVLVVAERSGSQINTSTFNAGQTVISARIDSVNVAGSGVVLTQLPISKTKTFNNNDSDRTITLQLVADIPIEDMSAKVVVQLEDEDGDDIDSSGITSYRATAKAIGTIPWDTRTANLTPIKNSMTVPGNTQAAVDAGRVTTTEITVDQIMMDGIGDIGVGEQVGTKVFNTFDNDNTIVIRVPIESKGRIR